MTNSNVEYLGYCIRKSNDPWAIKINLPYEYFKIEGDGELHGAGSVQDAIDEINCRLDEWQENFDKQNKAKIL